MYLSSIKLAGFKSFVDPTTIKFQSNLTSIVGPNGCGKSNVIDAIRWVIGESSAKNLRAESMADVIFNGTNKRKPVGQASVELIFDNSDGSLGGEYAAYREISVRRVLRRDGQSIYYLNNTRCRRKDIIDIFLGTGLGPRSYAIIEQGMISKLIEAKPDELRVYLEEAAGISKYKERRRETENRIRHTRENLERLADLREELSKQLGRLKRQANAAERYKILKQEQREQKAQLNVITWSHLKEKFTILEAAIKEQSLLVEQKITRIRELDTRIESQRLSQTEHSDEVNEIQKTFYGIGNEITKLEEQINHAKQRQAQLQSDIAQADNSHSDLANQLAEDEQQLHDVKADITNIEKTHQQYHEQALQIQSQLQTANDKMSEWQDRWDAFQQSSASTTRGVDVKQTQLQHLHQKQSTLNDRLERKQAQNQEFEFDGLSEQIQLDENSLSVNANKNNEIQAKLESAHERIREVRDQNHSKQTELNELNSQLQKSQGRLSSLEALQQAALHKNDDAQLRWLEQHDLEQNTRLAEIIEAEEGWETAVETVLASHLQAICVDDFNSLARALTEPLTEMGQLSMSFIQKHTPSSYAAHQETLLSKVKSDYDLTGLLHGIYLAETLNDALNLVKTLDAYESVVTKDGVWLSQNWLRISNEAQEQTGVLKRQHEIDSLQIMITDLESSIENKRSQYSEGKETLLHIEEQRNEYQNESRELNKLLSEVKSRLSSNRTKLEQLNQRQQQVSQEIDEMQEQLQETRKQIAEAEKELQTMEQRAQSELLKKETLHREKEQLRSQLQEVRSTADMRKQKADEMQIRLQSSRNQVHYLEQGIDRAKQQLAQLQERSAKMTEQLKAVTENVPEWSENLEALLEDRLRVETTLTEAKQILNHIEAELRQNEKQRHEIDDELQVVRETLDQNRMDNQTVKVKCETLEEQIQESGFDRNTVLNNLPDELNKETLAQNIEESETRINRLGPINLAAIEEYDEVNERKTYLDKQDEDLNEALETLENAIRKIDRETKAKFKDTYESASKLFSEYFPKIFGGGNASLELVGDDLLDAGVLVKAQPPGKRNSTIHLLSGGEKALTAIALVFSLFQLNPAPFCILDEVDAPLDDANVVRYCNLVSAMSEKIQFIYISHNKIAIEMAKQLCGVTMHEAGVSRLVTVDIDEAMKMAENA